MGPVFECALYIIVGDGVKGILALTGRNECSLEWPDAGRWMLDAGRKSGTLTPLASGVYRQASSPLPHIAFPPPIRYNSASRGETASKTLLFL
jgi:hypothetical protein